MSNSSEHSSGAGIDVGEYCRAVEAHLTRVNEGQLVRVVGPAFELVRGWALGGVPLSIVFHGVNAKAERHKAGRSTRPLRLEFCEHDVRAAYDQWRRAVGIGRTGLETDAPTDDVEAPRKHASLTKHFDRVIDRLIRAGSRADVSDAFRDGTDPIIGALSEMRDKAKGARGPARDEMVATLASLDADLMRVTRATAESTLVDRFRADATTELATYRDRLAPDAWTRSVELGVDRLLRDHFGLPTVAAE